MPRLYQPIWESLKANKKVTIQASPEVHRRIIKAVTKEKYNDIGYKVLNESSREILYCESKGSLIVFELREYSQYSKVRMADITSGEL